MPLCGRGSIEGSFTIDPPAARSVLEGSRGSLDQASQLPAIDVIVHGGRRPSGLLHQRESTAPNLAHRSRIRSRHANCESAFRTDRRNPSRPWRNERAVVHFRHVVPEGSDSCRVTVEKPLQVLDGEPWNRIEQNEDTCVAARAIDLRHGNDVAAMGKRTLVAIGLGDPRTRVRLCFAERT